jgi:hypothetical protein
MRQAVTRDFRTAPVRYEVLISLEPATPMGYDSIGHRAIRMIIPKRITMTPPAVVARALLDHPYYNRGLRFQITARSSEGLETPLVDGGAFDWVARLISNRRAVSRPR